MATLNHQNLLVCGVYRLYVYFHVQIILHHSSVSLPQEDAFKKVGNSYIESACYSICYDYGTKANEIGMNGDWFYITEYADFGSRGKATSSSPLSNFTQWIISLS